MRKFLAGCIGSAAVLLSVGATNAASSLASILSVAAIAQMSSLGAEAKKHTVVYVAGYNEPAATGGGIFSYYANCPLPVDGGIYISITGLPAACYVRRLENGVITPWMYGAYCDLTHDDNSSPSGALQRMWNAALAWNYAINFSGCRTKFSVGIKFSPTYGQALTVAGNATGDPVATSGTVLRYTGSSNAIEITAGNSASGGTSIKISGLLFNLGSAGNSATAIYDHGVPGINIRDTGLICNGVAHVQSGFVIDTSKTPDFFDGTNLYFENFQAVNCGGARINLRSSPTSNIGVVRDTLGRSLSNGYAFLVGSGQMTNIVIDQLLSENDNQPIFVNGALIEGFDIRAPYIERDKPAATALIRIAGDVSGFHLSGGWMQPDFSGTGGAAVEISGTCSGCIYDGGTALVTNLPGSGVDPKNYFIRVGKADRSYFANPGSPPGHQTFGNFINGHIYVTPWPQDR